MWVFSRPYDWRILSSEDDVQDEVQDEVQDTQQTPLNNSLSIHTSHRRLNLIGYRTSGSSALPPRDCNKATNFIGARARLRIALAVPLAHHQNQTHKEVPGNENADEWAKLAAEEPDAGGVEWLS